MYKKVEISALTILFIFAIYCTLIITGFWDENFEMTMGRERLRYIFSLGSYENFDFYNSKFYPGFYNTIAIFFTKMFPAKYETEIWRLSHVLFSILSIFGIYKISSILFNKKLGKIVFVLCFLNPIFFGHMIMNSKDTIVVFAHIWTTYIILRYLQKQDISHKSNNYIILAGLTIGLGTGVRLPFLITLLPLIIFTFLDIFFLKKIICRNFSLKKFSFHTLIVLTIAYLVTVSFWPQVHINIFTEPLKLFLEQIRGDVFGVKWILFNGQIFDTGKLPVHYLFTNFLFKSPEYLLFSYLVFVCLIAFKIDYFNNEFASFKLKTLLVLLVVIFPFLYFVLIPYRVYDGLRLFLYIIPYFSIIPALTLYYFLNNLNSALNKIVFIMFSGLFIYYLFVFISLTPFQYTYLNLLNGDFKKANEKFENDYLSVSVKELINQIPLKTNLISNKKITIAFCGVSHMSARKQLDKLKGLKYVVEDIQNSDVEYVMMTNRAIEDRNNNTIDNAITCFDKIPTKDIVNVKRRGLVLSAIRKKTT